MKRIQIRIRIRITDFASCVEKKVDSDSNKRIRIWIRIRTNGLGFRTNDFRFSPPGKKIFDFLPGEKDFRFSPWEKKIFYFLPREKDFLPRENGFPKRIWIRISGSCATTKVEWIRILDFGLNSCVKKKVKWIRIRIKFL